jgi:hypothetical protein
LIRRSAAANASIANPRSIRAIGVIRRQKEGKPYSVRYEDVGAMLLNEFLKEHRKVQKLEAAIKAISERLKEQDGRIQKVSDQVQMSTPAAQMVVED